MQNQGNKGNTGGENLSKRWADAKFVERTEMAIMQYAILAKAQQGEVTRENLQQTFRGSMKMESEHFDHCLKQLVQENHLREQGNKYTITDDGREDVQKLQHLVLELPNVVNQGGQTQRTGQTQQTGATGGTVTGGAGAGATRTGGMSNPQGQMGGQTGQNKNQGNR